MINDSSDRNALTSDVNTARVEMNADDASFFTSPPVNKLDADQYIAQDLDGSGESLFGSGNLNYLALQAAQIDEMMSGRSRSPIIGSEGDFFSGPSFGSSSIPVLSDAPFASQGNIVNSLGSEANRILNIGDNSPGEDRSNSQMRTSSTSNSSSTSSTTTTQSSSSTSSTTMGTDGEDGADGNDGTDGNDGNDGNDGTDGGGGGDTIIINNNNNNVINNNTTNNNTTNNETTNHYYPETNIFDTINNTVDNVTENVTNLFDTLDNTVNNASSILNSVTNIFEGGPGGLPGPPELTDLLPPGNPGDTDLGVNTGLGVVDGLMAGVEASPLVSIVEDLIGDTDNALHVGLGLLGTNDTAGPDTDITGQIGIDIVDQTLAGTNLEVNLDPVEALVGDIDVDLASVSNLLGAAADPLLDSGLGGTSGSILSPVGDVLSDVAQSILPQGNDSDLNIDLGIGIIDAPVANVAQSVSLDVVEQLLNHDINIDLTGDLNLLADTSGTGLPNISQEGMLADLNSQINDALNVLNQTGDPLGAVVSGQAGIDLNATLNFDSWTQSPLPDSNNVLSSVLDQLANAGGGSGGNAIPEPVGSLSEGLGSLFNIASHGHAGGHHGGLFG